MNLVNTAFMGKYDKGGKPYIFHLTTVAGKFDDLEAQTVGLLHDLIEDTEYSLDDLRAMGYPEDIVQAVDSITKRPNEPYEEVYLLRVKGNELARRVKLIDLHHNMDLERLQVVTDKDRKRHVKYLRAVGILQSWITK